MSKQKNAWPAYTSLKLDEMNKMKKKKIPERYYHRICFFIGLICF